MDWPQAGLLMIENLIINSGLVWRQQRRQRVKTRPPFLLLKLYQELSKQLSHSINGFLQIFHTGGKRNTHIARRTKG